MLRSREKILRFLANLRPGKVVDVAFKPTLGKLPLVPPLLRFFHAALGYTWLYYTSTFLGARKYPPPIRSQLIDAIAIAQNEIAATSVDGRRENKAVFGELPHAEAQRSQGGTEH